MDYNEIYEAAFNDELEKTAGPIGAIAEGLAKKMPSLINRRGWRYAKGVATGARRRFRKTVGFRNANRIKKGMGYGAVGAGGLMIGKHLGNNQPQYQTYNTLG